MQVKKKRLYGNRAVVRSGGGRMGGWWRWRAGEGRGRKTTTLGGCGGTWGGAVNKDQKGAEIYRRNLNGGGGGEMGR